MICILSPKSFNSEVIIQTKPTMFLFFHCLPASCPELWHTGKYPKLYFYVTLSEIIKIVSPSFGQKKNVSKATHIENDQGYSMFGPEVKTPNSVSPLLRVSSLSRLKDTAWIRLPFYQELQSTRRLQALTKLPGDFQNRRNHPLERVQTLASGEVIHRRKVRDKHKKRGLFF